ncbi:hypothetical protein PUN28_001934 [Cardiocondyla obscurior]|uniref:Uncharacterized protein n=1 Tax=Cardiocondyla obscurior TaxID=286306 RepID=A0AAW2GS13_9HYME
MKIVGTIVTVERISQGFESLESSRRSRKLFFQTRCRLPSIHRSSRVLQDLSLSAPRKRYTCASKLKKEKKKKKTFAKEFIYYSFPRRISRAFKYRMTKLERYHFAGVRKARTRKFFVGVRLCYRMGRSRRRDLCD